MDSLYTFKILDAEHTGMINDIVRMVTIQFSIQFLCFLNTPDTPFWTVDFILLVVYVVMGVCLYWLVIKKLINVTPRE